MINTKHLVPMYEVTQQMKETFLSLQLSDILERIKKRCEKFVECYFVEKSIGSQFELGNLNCDLEYLFSEGLFFLNMIQDAGYEIDNAEHFVEMFVRFDEKGYKSIVGFYVDKYSEREDRLYTEKELNDMKEKMAIIAKDILKDINWL